MITLSHAMPGRSAVPPGIGHGMAVEAGIGELMRVLPPRVRACQGGSRRSRCVHGRACLVAFWRVDVGRGQAVEASCVASSSVLARPVWPRFGALRHAMAWRGGRVSLCYGESRPVLASSGWLSRGTAGRGLARLSRIVGACQDRVGRASLSRLVSAGQVMLRRASSRSSRRSSNGRARLGLFWHAKSCRPMGGRASARPFNR